MDAAPAAAFAMGKSPLLSIRSTKTEMGSPERRKISHDLFYQNPNPYAEVPTITKTFLLRGRNRAAEILKELNEFPTIDLFLVPLLRQEVNGNTIYQTFPIVGSDLATIEPDVYKENRARIIQTLNQAVDFLHSRNILHRDIKPENVIWDSHPDVLRAKLIDFDSLVRVNGDELIEANTFGGTIGHRNITLRKSRFSKDRDRFCAEITIQALDRTCLGDVAAALLWPAGFSLETERFLPKRGGMRSRATRKHRQPKKNDRLRAGQSRRRNRSRTLARQL